MLKLTVVFNFNLKLVAVHVYNFAVCNSLGHTWLHQSKSILLFGSFVLMQSKTSAKQMMCITIGFL